MDSLILCASAAVCSAILGLVLKKLAPEFGTALSMFVSASILIYALVCVSGIRDVLTELISRASLEDFGAAAVPRIAAACAVSAFSAQLCRSAGDEVTAWAVEVLGTVTSVLISLPLWQGVLELFLSFL